MNKPYKKYFKKKLREGSFNLQKMLNSYLDAALWKSTDYEGYSLEDNYTIKDISKEAIQTSKKIIQIFIKKAGPLLKGLDEEEVGIDFYLTQNVMNTGFEERSHSYGDEKSKKLDKIANQIKYVTFYVGKDNKIYIDTNG